MDGIVQMIRDELGILPYIFSIVIFFFVRYFIKEDGHSKVLGTVVGLIVTALFIVFWAKALAYGLIVLSVFVFSVFFFFMSF
jgi:hypothetical protein